MTYTAIVLPSVRISSVQLFSVSILVLLYINPEDSFVNCLYRSAPAVEAEGLYQLRHNSTTLIRSSDKNDDIIRARQRLGLVVGMAPAATPSNINKDTQQEQLTLKQLYQRVGDRVQLSKSGLGPIIINGSSGTKKPHTVVNEVDERECILGRTHHYTTHWLNPNGTINTENSDIEDIFLDLSYNTQANIVREIRPFLAKRQLIYLSLAYIGITVVPRAELNLVNTSLAYLSLMGNVLYPFSLPVLNNLRVLDLRYCGFTALPSKVFSNTPNLIKLFLGHNNFVKLDAVNFDGLTRLRHLDLSYIVQHQISSMYGMEQQADPYNSLTEGLNLGENVFAPLTSLTFLDVSYTKLLSSSARAFREVAVEQLSLCYTGIPIIVGSMMNGSLKVLDISGNPGITTAIHHGKSEARGFNANLEILVCENSTVKHLDWLMGMVSLKVLLLNTNNINQLTNETFANMAALEILDLSNNHVSNWHQRVFESNENLYILDVSENNINVLTSEMLHDFAEIDFLAIGQNSFVCHCLLREFIELAAKNSQSISCLIDSIVNQIQDTATQAPKIEKDKEFSESYTTIRTVTRPMRERITPPVTVEKNPKYNEEDWTLPATEEPSMVQLNKSVEEYNVLFRVVHSYISTIYDSSTKFQESFEKYTRGRPSGRVYRKMVDARVRSHFLPGKGCSGNETLEKDDEKGDNETMVYPDYDEPLFGLHMQIIDFDEDSYKCIDLDNSEFYLYEQERCKFDRSMLDNLNLASPMNTTTANIIKYTLMFFGFALVAFIIYISKWEYIKYFCIIVRNATVLSLLKHKNESRLRKESLTSVVSDYTYDVFVSYSEQDRDWVLDEMLPNLEKTEDINVCLHERDFQVGVSILENIIHCMDKSRTLLLVMSECFLLSHWCQFEMHLAQHRLLETRREQLILVLLEDIPRSKRPKTLQYLMKTKTYIIWPQPDPESQSSKRNTKKPPKKDSAKNERKVAERREKDAQALTEERKLFWKRLRKAINDSGVWEPDIAPTVITKLE